MKSMLRNHVRAGVTACLAVMTLAATAGCGSSSSLTASRSSAASSSTGAASSTPGADAAAVARAQKILAPFTGHPSPFPVTAPLKSAPAHSTRIVYLDCSAPTCGLFLTFMRQAAQVAGVSFSTINAGSTASTLAGAWSSVLSQRPDAIIVPAALDPSTWGQSTLAEIKAKRIPVILTGVTDATRYGLNTYPDLSVGVKGFTVLAQLEAAYIVAHEKLPATVAYTSVPDLGFSSVMTSAFTRTLGQLCPKCSVITLPLTVQSLGTTAPARIVSLLQAHPNVSAITTVTGEIFHGLTPALRQAGLHVDVIGVSGDPENLADLKAGAEQANVESSLAIAAWTCMDAALRAAQRQQFDPGEGVTGLAPVQVLQPAEVTFNPDRGWAGYDDFVSRFAKLWHPPVG